MIPLPGSAEALVVNTKQTTTEGVYDQYRYCNDRHWSYECTNYSTIEERRKQLNDSYFKCLKVGHLSKDCKKNKTYVYCGEEYASHRSLCPRKFKFKKSKRKVQGVPQSQTAALPRHQEEEETDKSKQAQTEQTFEKH